MVAGRAALLLVARVTVRVAPPVAAGARPAVLVKAVTTVMVTTTPAVMVLPALLVAVARVC
jgi:hypothetical protein